MNPSKYESLSPAEAVAYQWELKQRIDLSPFKGKIRTIAGADISFNKFSPLVYAGIVVLSFPDLTVLDRVGTIAETSFPYVSGLLAFREVPALLQAWEQLKIKPDVMVLDGQGIAHPRRLGIATHFGLLTDTPAVGVAKSRLYGRFTEPAAQAGSFTHLMDNGEQIGLVYRTKNRCKPVFISPGHRISMMQSLELIRNCVKGYRIPEPTRQAHLWVNELRIQNSFNSTQTKLFE